MAEVTMTLLELDTLRDDLKIAKETIATKDQVIKEKDEEIVRVQNDKRTVLVTHKETVPDIFSRKLHSRELYSRENSEYRCAIQELTFKLGGRYNQHGIADILENAGFIYFGRYPTRITPDVTTTREFVNFEDVKVEIRQQLETASAAQIDGYLKTISELRDKLSASDIKYQKEIDTLAAKWKDKFDEADLQWRKKYDTLTEDYKLLQEDKKRQSLEARIAELEAENFELKNKKKRSWF